MSVKVSSFNSTFATYGNFANGKINRNSKQYKALEKNDVISDIIQEEMVMTPEQKMLYEMLGGREAFIRNWMSQYDEDGDLKNQFGIGGMDTTGKGTSWQQLIDVPEEHRQKMFDTVKREFIRENGIANGDTTNRSEVFKDYQLSVSKDKRLSGTWTLGEYERGYRVAMYNAVKAANPNWQLGQPFDSSVLKNITRETVESTLVKTGNTLTARSIDISV